MTPTFENKLPKIWTGVWKNLKLVDVNEFHDTDMVSAGRKAIEYYRRKVMALMLPQLALVGHPYRVPPTRDGIALVKNASPEFGVQIMILRDRFWDTTETRLADTPDWWDETSMESLIEEGHIPDPTMLGAEQGKASLVVADNTQKIKEFNSVHSVDQILGLEGYGLADKLGCQKAH